MTKYTADRSRQVELPPIVVKLTLIGDAILALGEFSIISLPDWKDAGNNIPGTFKKVLGTDLQVKIRVWVDKVF